LLNIQKARHKFFNWNVECTSKKESVMKLRILFATFDRGDRYAGQADARGEFTLREIPCAAKPPELRAKGSIHCCGEIHNQ